MSQSPHRPFVPHLTPKRAAPAISLSEFRLSRPFVPGSERESVVPETRPQPRSVMPGIEDFAVSTSESRAESTHSLPGIRDFLDRSPPSVTPAMSEWDDQSYGPVNDEDADEPPPVEHFMDPLPGVGEYARDSANAFDEALALTDEGPVLNAPAPDVSGWVETDWQQFDWRAAAALGEGAESEASNDWAATNWDAGTRRAKDVEPSTAQSIASALDQIARQIREGQLGVPAPGTVADPATLAATLAALLGIKR